MSAAIEKDITELGYPKGWRISPLKYIAEQNKKVLPESTKPEYSFRYVDIGAVNSTAGIQEYKEMVFESAPSRARRVVTTGDTIISTVRTYLRAIAYVEDAENVVVSTGFSVQTPKNDIWPKYLYYYCTSDAFVECVNKYSAGVAYPAISDSLLGRIEIAYPDIKEQKAIASFLDQECAKIESIIDDLEKQIDALRHYREAVISETISKGLNDKTTFADSGIGWIGEVPSHWEIKRLRYLGILQNGISKEGESFGSGYPFVSYGDVYNNSQLPETVKGLVESTAAERRLFSVHYGDVFFTRTSETIEEIGIASTCLHSIEDATFAGFLIRFRPTTDELYPGYCKYYFRAEMLRRYFVKEMMIVTRASLGQNLLKNLPVLIPPKDEQLAIAQYLDEKCAVIDSILNDKENQIQEMKSRKQALIYEYVTGKKRVKEAVPYGN